MSPGRTPLAVPFGELFEAAAFAGKTFAVVTLPPLVVLIVIVAEAAVGSASFRQRSATGGDA
jgi:hypothetical protein